MLIMKSESLQCRTTLLKKEILLTVAVLFIQCCNLMAQQSLPQSSQDPLLPVDPNRPAGYPVRGMKHSNPTTVSVGSVLDSSEAKETFLKVIEEMSLEPNINAPGVVMYAVHVPLNQNPVRTAQAVCERLIKSEVYVMILTDGSVPESSSALAVTQTCSYYQIPVIGLQNRDSSFSDKHVYSTYLRTVPPYSHQVDVWIEILKELDYRYVVFIHSADYDGRSSFSRFEGLAEEANIHIKAVIEYEPGLTNIAEELEDADEEMKVRVYLMYANEIDSQAIFVEVARLNMTAPGYVWIVSEQSLLSPNVPDGIMGLKLFNASNTGGHIRDAVYIIGMALKEMYFNENITRPPSTCGDIGHGRWDSGHKLFNYLRKQSLSYGRTGRVSFDGKGDRIDADYEIINVVHGRPVMAGQYAYAQSKSRMQLWLNPTNIVWPGYQTIKPIGFVIPTHLKVATIEEEPFIFSRLPRPDGSCDYDQIPCPKFDPDTRRERMFCCEGYCVDFLRSLSIRLNFSYSLYQVIDSKYGDFEYVNGTEYPKMWTGLVGDLVYKRTDMVVAPLTINPERSLVVEFSKPFKYQGITILQKIKPRKTTFRFFNEPLSDSLWLLVGITVHLVAVALYLLDRFSPFGRYKLPDSDITEEDALNLSSAIWFAWGVLLNSGIGEGTPRSFGGRILGIVWAGFSMLLLASYTANLAAFLVLDRPQTALTGINDPRIRNPADGFKMATIAGSAVEMYFKRQLELNAMYKLMKDHSYPDVESAVLALKNDELDALIWDSSRLDYEAAQHCDLTTATEQFGRSGYGIGLPKNSFWAERVNQEVLAMHESGFMEELDQKWILMGVDNYDDNCPTVAERQKPASLTLYNMAGVFILVGIGIVGGVGLIGIEVIYKKSQVKQQRQLDVARHAAERWKRLVERRKNYRDSVHYMRQAQLMQQQSEQEEPPSSGQRTYRKHRGGAGGGGTSGRKSPHIPPPHQQAMQKQLEQEQQQQPHHKSSQQLQHQHSHQQSQDSQQSHDTVGHSHHHSHLHHQHQVQPMPPHQQQQQQQVIYTAQQQAQLLYEQQKAAAKQQLHQQKQAQQQQQLQQQGIMKAPKHYHYQHQHQHQQAAPVISPPEGFQSDSPFPGSLIELNTQEAELTRRLHAKAQLYATEPRQHRKDKKNKKSSKGIQSDPMPINDDSYELCVASDAELHTIGTHHHHQQASQHYFSLPRNHQHHRPVSASPRNVQTLMRGSQASTGYRRNDDYGYNYSA